MQPVDWNQSEKYCVFRSGNERFCVPALAIRNVGPRPALCRLPMTDDVLAGLAHEQREFFPVYSFCTARGMRPEAQMEQQMLVLINDSGPWGLLIDEVLGLESLELSLNAHRGQAASWSSVSVGSTAFKDHFVTAIDSQNLCEFVQVRLNQSWNQTRQQAMEQTNSALKPKACGHTPPATQE